MPVKAKHLVPNAVTLANIAFGFFAVVAAAQHDFKGATWLLFGAALCDLADGKLARLLDASSKFGMELDSLSDAISFGIAPAVLIYLCALVRLGTPGAVIAVGYALCGVLRLARYNVDDTPIAQYTFQGVPIPIAAGYLMSFVMVRDRLPISIIAVGTAAMAVAMVTKVKIPKFRRGRGLPSSLLYIGLATFIAFLIRPSPLTWHIWNGWNVVLVLLNYVVLARGLGRTGEQVNPLRRAA